MYRELEPTICPAELKLDEATGHDLSVRSSFCKLLIPKINLGLRLHIIVKRGKIQMGDSRLVWNPPTLDQVYGVWCVEPIQMKHFLA
jgi:hypothetical protein